MSIVIVIFICVLTFSVFIALFSISDLFLSFDCSFNEKSFNLTVRKLYAFLFKKDFIIEISSFMEAIVIPKNSDVLPFRIFPLGSIKYFVSVKELSYSELSKIVSELISETENIAVKNSEDDFYSHFINKKSVDNFEETRKYILSKKNDIKFIFIKESKY